MSEGSPKPEAASAPSGIDAFEALVAKGEWTAEIERALDALLEQYEEDLYMLFLNYEASGLTEELVGAERRMYARLAEAFEGLS